MLKIVKIYILFLILAPLFPLQALEPVVPAEGKNKYPLGLYLEILEDTSGRLTLADVTKPELQKRWIRSKEVTPNFNFSDSTYWFRFKINNSLEEPENMLLEVASPLIDYINVYIEDERGNIIETRTGDRRIFNTRMKNHRQFLFDLKLPPGHVLITYLQIKSHDGFHEPLSLKLWTPGAFMSEDSQVHYFWGILLGIMLVMAFYNFFIYIFLRDISYLYYFVFLLGVLLWVATLHGFTFKFFWPEFPDWNNEFLIISSNFSVFSLLIFTRSYLNTARNTPGLDNILKYLAGFFLFIAALSHYVAYSVVIFLSIPGVLIGHITCIITGVRCLKQGNRPAKYYILAFFIVFCGTSLFSLRAGGFITSNFIAENGVLIGLVLAVVILSLGLADRIKVIREENDRTREQALQIQKEAAENLELKVAERTREVEIGRKQLEDLSTVSRQVSEAGDLISVLTTLHKTLLEQLGPLAVYLLLIDEHSGELYTESYRPIPGSRFPDEKHKFIKEFRIPLEPGSGSLYRAYRKKRSFLLEHVNPNRLKESPVDLTITENLGLKPFVNLPLLVKKEVIGILVIRSESAISRKHRRWLELFADQIAGAVYSAKLLSQAEQSRAEIERLNRLSKRINESTNIDAVLDDVFSYFLQKFRIDGALLFLYDHETDELYTAKQSRALSQFETTELARQLDRFSLAPSIGTLFLTFHRRKTFYVRGATRQLKRNNMAKLDRSILEILGFGNLLEVPLVIHNRSIGILCLTRLTEPMRLSKAELDSIERTCEQIAGAVHGSSLFRQVHTQTWELAQANTKLQQMDKARTRFFANMSHEFRTPLALMLAPVESILTGDMGKSIQSNNDIFQSIHQNGRQLLRIINNMLNFTKIESGRMKAQKQQTDMVEFLRFYQANVEPVTEINGLRTTFQYGAKELLACIDRDLMGKAVMNLLSNAFKFTPPGGKISVRLEQIDAKHLSITVKDSGIGVPAESLDTIFNRFSQVEESTTHKRKGTGIGLSLAREIAKLHEGDITVRSKPGRGSLFTLTINTGEISDDTDCARLLPNEDLETIAEINSYFISEPHEGELDDGEPSVNEINSPDKNNNSREYTILLVEDHNEMRSYLKRLLKYDYNVVTAVNGYQGLAKSQEFKPDLILSDVMMPEMDGNEMTNELKSAEETRDIPVILLSAKADVIHRLEGLEFGADDYLSKPFHPKELLARIRNQLAGKQMERALRREKWERDKEFFQASLIQKTILTPKSVIDQIEELEVELLYLPMDNEISGDYYHVSPMDKGIASILVADATGHGTQAALTTMQIDILYKENLLRKYPDERFEDISDRFVSELRSKNYFTGINVDIYKNKIRYSSAGHPEQYLIQSEKKEIRTLRTRGGNVGMAKNQSYEMEEVATWPGDLLLLFSDGIFEVFNKDREQFGEERFYNLLKQGLEDGLFTRTLKESVEVILKEIDEFRGDIPYSDDITLFVIRLK